MLHVSARDKATNKQQSIRIEASSGLSKDDIDRMKNEAKANEETDLVEKERIDKLNAADSLVFQTEKQLKEFGDKIPADKKAPIEAALTKLKEAHKSQNFDQIDKATAELNQVFQAASEEMYRQGQNPGGPQAGPNFQDFGQQNNTQQDKKQSGDDVTDVDYEEVK